MTFSGGEAITSERMEDIFTAEMRQATRNPFGALRYVQSATESAADRIRQALVQDGFLGATVQVKPDFEGRMVNVTVTATPVPNRLSMMRWSRAPENSRKRFARSCGEHRVAFIARTGTDDSLAGA